MSGSVIIAEPTARISDAENERARTRADRPGKIHARQVQRQAAIVMPEFADAEFRPKHGQSARGLDAGMVVRMTEIEEIGRNDHEGLPGGAEPEQYRRGLAAPNI